MSGVVSVGHGETCGPYRRQREAKTSMPSAAIAQATADTLDDRRLTDALATIWLRSIPGTVHLG
jgi:hypothetical protein